MTILIRWPRSATGAFNHRCLKEWPWSTSSKMRGYMPAIRTNHMSNLFYRLLRDRSSAHKILCYAVHPSKDISPNAIINEMTHYSDMLSDWISHMRADDSVAVSEFRFPTKYRQNVAFTHESYASLEWSACNSIWIRIKNKKRREFVPGRKWQALQFKKSMRVFQNRFNSSSDKSD